MYIYICIYISYRVCVCVFCDMCVCLRAHAYVCKNQTNSDMISVSGHDVLLCVCFWYDPATSFVGLAVRLALRFTIIGTIMHPSADIAA